MSSLANTYIVHLETNFCPLDAQSVADLKQHYKRGMEPNEQLQQLCTRLDQEQDNLRVEDVIISNNDQFNHNLTEIYNSGMFSAETITQRTETPVADQTYVNARTFFEGKLRSMKTAQRLTAKSGAANHGFSTTAATLELKELGNSINEVVWETVNEALSEHLPQHELAPLPTDHANALSNLKDASSNQKKVIEELIKAVLALTKEVKELKNNRASKERNSDDKENAPPSNNRRRQQKYEWADDLKFNKERSYGKKSWYRQEFKTRDLEGWKSGAARTDRQRAELE